MWRISFVFRSTHHSTPAPITSNTLTGIPATARRNVLVMLSGTVPPGLGITTSAKPEKIEDVAKVTISGWSRTIPTITPLSSPQRAPTAIAATKPSNASESSPCMTVTATTLDRATIAPSERSRPPLMTTTVCAMATRTSGTKVAKFEVIE